MKYRNTVQQARKKFLKQQRLSAKEQSIIEKDFRGKDYAYYLAQDDDELLLPEKYSAEATFRTIKRRCHPGYNVSVLLKYAAAVVLLLIATFGFYHLNTQPEMLLVSTSYGEKKDIRLPDGSVVKLNSLSSLSYPKKMKGDTREVVLVGEALFDVVKDPKRTFIVRAQQVEVNVLGTTFDVAAYADDEEIITRLYEGKVAVKLDSGEAICLNPGEQAVYNKQNQSLRIEPQTTDEQHWTDCNLCFEHRSLKEILKVLEREKNISFEISEDVNKTLRITASFDRGESVEDILTILGQSGDFMFEKKGAGYNIKAKEPC